MKQFQKFIAAVVCTVALLLVTFFTVNGRAATYHSSRDSSPIPTVFVHGLKGSPRSTNGMIAYFSEYYYGAQRVQTINVWPDGTLQVEGEYQEIDHPLIQINFVNRNASIPQDNVWLTEALHYIKTVDGVRRFDAVGHSAGCVTLLQTEMLHRKDLPIMEKFVSIAGTYNGLLGENDYPHAVKLNSYYRPDHAYLRDYQYPAFNALVKEGCYFPKDIQVLNIYGDVNDGTDSDGTVTTQSALSLNYILRRQILKIRNVKCTGVEFKHSGLRKSPLVYQQIGQFLWGQRPNRLAPPVSLLPGSSIKVR